MSKTLAEKIAVMQAAEQGKKIQFKGEHHNAWRDLSGCVWNWESNDYRVKPEPKTLRMTVQELTDEVAKRRVWARNHTLQWFELNKLSKIKCVESDANLEISYDLKTWQKPEVTE